MLSICKYQRNLYRNIYKLISMMVYMKLNFHISKKKRLNDFDMIMSKVKLFIHAYLLYCKLYKK